MTIRVLLVDDQPLIRLGLAMILQDAGDIEVIGEADDGAGGVAQARALAPDVILLDIRMPVMDGIEATRRIMAADPPARVLVLTTYDTDDNAYAALRAGASGFVLKDAPVAELVQAVRAVADGHAAVAPRVTRLLLDTYARRLPEPADLASAAVLTAREREVLGLVARGLTNAEIAGRLTVSELTVKTHVSAVLGKLALRNRVAAVIWAYDHRLVD